MTSASEIAAQLLAFTVSEFAATADVDLSERARSLLYSDFEGVAISAPYSSPKATALVVDAPFPVAVGYRMPGARSWDAPIGRNSLLVARNTLDGRVMLRDPFAVPGGHKRHSQRAPLDRGERPPENQFPAASADVVWVDAQARGLTRLPGQWHLNLIWYDWVSNEVIYEVAGPEPVVTPREIYLPEVNAPDTGPSTIDSVDAPGIALTAGRRDGGGDVVRVHGQIILPLRDHMQASADDKKEGIAAVLPLTLLLMAPNAAPYSVRFHIPAQVTGNFAQADFTVDLGADGSDLPKGALVLWGFADEALVGPVHIE